MTPKQFERLVRRLVQALEIVEGLREEILDNTHAGTCPVCDCGELDVPGRDDKTCPVCHGHGLVDCGNDPCTKGC